MSKNNSQNFKGAQECARAILDKNPEEVREMLCLPAENVRVLFIF